MIRTTRYSTSAEINRQAQLSSDIAKLQQQVSTGKRLTAASDDPNAAARISAIRQQQANNKVWEQNADTGTTIASTVDDKLTTMASALDRANEILITARNDTNSTVDRSALATELNGIADDLDSYANATDSTGAALFPDGTPHSLPVSDTLSLTATVGKTAVFNLPASSGGQSIADFLRAAATHLTSGNTSGISTDLDTLGVAISQTGSVRTDQGLREQRFSDAKDRLTNSDTDLATERSSLEDTDLSTALSDVQSKQLALQAAQTVFAKEHKSTLFDILG